MTKHTSKLLLIIAMFSLSSCAGVFMNKEERKLDEQNLFMECKTFFGGRNIDCMRSALEKKMIEAKQEYDCEGH